jgi:hypothetical protein
MYRTLADPEFSGGGADRGSIFDNIQGQPLGPFLHVPFHTAALPAVFAPFYEKIRAGMRNPAKENPPPAAFSAWGWTFVRFDV